MNPFLHNPVASRPAIQPCVVRMRANGAVPPRAGRSAAAGLARMMGSLAIAAGMSFAAMPAHALDVNSATAEQLTGIRGVGPKTADVIIKERERGGRFESLEDLSDRVRGIGPKKAQALQAAGLRVESAAGAPAAPRVGTTPAQDAKGRPDARGGTARPGARLGGRANP